MQKLKDELSNLPPVYIENFNRLGAKNADPVNWEWDAESKDEWEVAGQRLQRFNDRWYGSNDSLKSPLSLEPLLSPENPARLILVRESYVTMFDHVWARAMTSKGRTGTIITGQPGIGKTLFQYYLLVRLLQRKQVVLFLDGPRLYLFYHNQVYTVSAAVLESARPSLRFPRRTSGVFIWSLFDIRDAREPAEFMVNPPCLPVQTASPNRNRYKTWQKERDPMFTGLPLWTRDELAEGLTYQARYSSLMEALRKFCSGPSSQDQIDPLFNFRGIRVVLESCEDIASMSPEAVRDYLLGAAIDRFGYSAREVFFATFNYKSITSLHQTAFNIEHEKLKAAIISLANGASADPTLSHRILALCPVYPGIFSPVEWLVTFKSDWVRRSVIQKLSEAEGDAALHFIATLQRIPTVHGLAGEFLEPLAHRSISGN